MFITCKTLNPDGLLCGSFFTTSLSFASHKANEGATLGYTVYLMAKKRIIRVYRNGSVIDTTETGAPVKRKIPCSKKA